MQKKCAPSLLISRFNGCLAGIPLAGALAVFGGTVGDLVNRYRRVNLRDRDVA